MAVNFLLHTALRNQCFTFVFYWNPFDFQNSPQDCLQGRGQTPQHRGSSKSDPTRTFQLRLSLLPLHTALEQNPSCLAPNMLKRGDDEVHSVWVFFPSLVMCKFNYVPEFSGISESIEWRMVFLVFINTSIFFKKGIYVTSKSSSHISPIVCVLYHGNNWKNTYIL